MIPFVILNLSLCFCSILGRSQWLFNDKETVILYEFFQFKNEVNLPSNVYVREISKKKSGKIIGSTARITTKGSIYFNTPDYLQVKSDPDLTPVTSYTIEIITNTIYPDGLPQSFMLYSFIKPWQTGLKIAKDGSMLILSKDLSGNNILMKADEFKTSFSYMALAFDLSQKTLYIYKNGFLVGNSTLARTNYNNNLYIGSCHHSCGVYDFEGDVFAFKWSNSFKTQPYFQNTWERSNNFYSKIFFSSSLNKHFSFYQKI